MQWPSSKIYWFEGKSHLKIHLRPARQLSDEQTAVRAQIFSLNSWIRRSVNYFHNSINKNGVKLPTMTSRSLSSHQKIRRDTRNNLLLLPHRLSSISFPSNHFPNTLFFSSVILQAAHNLTRSLWSSKLALNVCKYHTADEGE